MTIQFGPGAPLQSQCPAFQPPPNGYVPWTVAAYGPMPSNISDHVAALNGDTSKPLGFADTVYVGSVPWIVRVDALSWMLDPVTGAATAGCFRQAVAYVSTGEVIIPPAPAAASSSGTTLFLVSLALGATVSGLAIYDRFSSR